VHQYNAPVIADYEAQLKNLADHLRASSRRNKTVVLRGGGGMGAGTEYLMPNGQEFEPHALSTQASFQFSYEFRKARADANAAGGDAQCGGSCVAGATRRTRHRPEHAGKPGGLITQSETWR